MTDIKKEAQKRIDDIRKKVKNRESVYSTEPAVPNLTDTQRENWYDFQFTDDSPMDSRGRIHKRLKKDIPLKTLINRHSKQMVTPEQIKAAEYFVKEEINAEEKVRKTKISELEKNARIRAKLVHSDLSEMVDEYKKELADPAYAKKQRDNRLALEIKSQSFLTR